MGDIDQHEGELIRAARRQIHGGPDGAEHAPTPTTVHLPPATMPDNAFPGYTMLREIGRAGQGVVYRAIQTSTKRRVAIKVLREGGFAAAGDRSRFQREVEILGQLQHPGIVGIHDSGEMDGRFYYVMDYIAGEPLDRYLDHARRPVEARVRLFRQICEAVNAAHLKGIIHRDLKPGNILVDEAGTPHVLDFGLAKVALADRSPATMTVTGQFMGSLPWSSPEQAEAIPGKIDMRTDVYSLGVIFYQMLTRHFPYNVVGSMRDVLGEIINAEPRRPSAIAREVDDELDTIVLKCLQKERERRYQTAGELARDLGHYLASEPIEAKRDSTWYLLRKTLRRYRAPAAIAVAFTVFAVVAAVTLYLSYQREADYRALAERRSEEVLRVADLKGVEYARDEANRLWPAYPENIAAMRQWRSERAAPLQKNLARHEATLLNLRAQALPYDDAQQEHDRATHPRAEQLAFLETRRAELMTDLQAIRDADVDHAPVPTDKNVDDLEAKVAALQQKIEAVRLEVSQRRTWKFDAPDTQWWHDLLTQLVEELRDFNASDPQRGTVASITARIALAERIGRESVTGPAATAAWRTAVTDIATSEVYDGLMLTPQMGLLPLGCNARTGLWEFWHLPSGERPRPQPDADAASRWVIGNDTGIVMVLVPGGRFLMGAQSEDPGAMHYDPEAYPHERPVHRVEIEPFFMSRYEMTQGQWVRFTGTNPSQHAGKFTNDRGQDDLTHPVEYVSWLDCQRVLQRLGLALPTEVQWEYAARAGSESIWWTGNEVAALQGAANVADAGSKRYAPQYWVCEASIRDGHFLHAPVGTFAANAFGLHDVVGNNWEWCRDRYAGYRVQPRPGDGLREYIGNRERIIRGGGFNVPAAFGRSTHRIAKMPDYVIDHLGVRPARRMHR